MPSSLFRRRLFLQTPAAVAGPWLVRSSPLWLPVAAAAAPSPPSTPPAPPVAGGPRLVQLLDSRADEQELVRDYAAGLQTAVKTTPLAAGQRAVLVQAVTVAPQPGALDALLRELAADPGVLGLVGTAGEGLSAAVADTLQQARLLLPHIAPWLPDTRHDAVPELVNLFASREVQMQHTLATLDGMGLRQLGVVYDGSQTQQTVQRGLDATLQRLALQAPRWTAPAVGGVEQLVRQLPAGVPPVLTFAGGSIELARFVQALAARPMHRTVVSLANADTGLLDQLGATRAMPLVLTQVVPNPRSTQSALARRYREQHQRLFDDAPSPAGLAGYVAGRYALRLLARGGANPSRQALLDEVRRRPDADIDGFALRFADGRGRGSRFVTQTMVTRDGRWIG